MKKSANSRILITLILFLFLSGPLFLMLLKRSCPRIGDSWDDPPGVKDGYFYRIERVCSGTFPRPVPGGRATQGESAALYVRAIAAYPDLTCDHLDPLWKAMPKGIEARLKEVTPIDATDKSLPEETLRLFSSAIGNIIEGSRMSNGRSILHPGRNDPPDDNQNTKIFRLSNVMTEKARMLAAQGNEAESCRLLSSEMIFNLDLARGSALLGHTLSAKMTGNALRGGVIPYAAMACDPQALAELKQNLEIIFQEDSMPSFNNALLVEQVYLETLYAWPFMPPGWKPPAAWDMRKDSRRSIKQLGPTTVRQAWEDTIAYFESLRDSIQGKEGKEKYTALTTFERETQNDGIIDRLKYFIRPGALFADIGKPAYSKYYKVWLEAEAYRELAVELISKRLAFLEADENASGPALTFTLERPWEKPGQQKSAVDIAFPGCPDS